MPRLPEITSENLSAAPAENGTGARLINNTQQAGTGTGRRSDLQQSSLPFPEPPSRRGVCRECGGPLKYIGKLKTGPIYRCSHCGRHDGELSHCKSTQTQVDSRVPYKCETAEVGASAASVIKPCVVAGSVGQVREDGVRTPHVQQ